MRSSKDYHREIRKPSSVISNQCKETEENNGMVKARDIFKKIGDTNIKGIFHAKMGTTEIEMAWT